MKLIVPMSGLGTRFQAAGYSDPKPLISVDGKPIIEHLLDEFPRAWDVLFICNEEHLQTTEMRSILKTLRPSCEIVGVTSEKKGPVWAVLQALRVDSEIISDAEPCLVSYCDYSLSWNPVRFERFVSSTQCDGAILCYKGFHPEYIRPTMYAYCREEGGKVSDIKEKGCFTENRENEFASCGAYYFKSGFLVKKYFTQLMDQGPLLNGEGYISLVYQKLLAEKRDVRVFEIPFFMQWGTPQDLADYNYWAHTFQKFLEPQKTNPKEYDFDVLMPMAGRGSRFGDAIPKPMIPVMGQPMFLSALNNMPAGQKKYYVTRTAFVDAVREHALNGRIINLKEVTAGQALTCHIGAAEMSLDRPVLVTSCDHGLVWSPQKWEKLLETRPDVIVVGQKNYPMANVTPQAFAYIQTRGNSDDIDFVSVKKPISENPWENYLLVGTFYFKSVKVMIDLIDELVEKNVKVNNEFYLDSVINIAIERNMSVKIFESDGYLCWGTPQSLNEFNYWYSYFCGLERL